MDAGDDDTPLPSLDAVDVNFRRHSRNLSISIGAHPHDKRLGRTNARRFESRKRRSSNDLHRPAAEHKARPHEDRESRFLRATPCLLHRAAMPFGGLPQFQLVDQRAETSRDPPPSRSNPAMFR